MTKIGLLLVTLVLAGCSAALVPMSFDPETKLSQARELVSLDRPIPAERLITEAINIYKEKQNSKGLGDSYFQYGLLLVSPAYRKYENFWRDVGKYDPSPATAINYLEESLKFYSEASDPEGQRAASFQLGRLYAMSGEVQKACDAYDKSSEYHKAARLKFPSHDFYVAPGTQTWEGTVSLFKKQAGCGS